MFSNGREAESRDRPAPTPSRYGFTVEIDAKELPMGVTIREVRGGNIVRYFVKNTSDTPLIINERFQNDQLVTGAKLVSGKVYGYFPNGVPMEGKTHLKGWQAPFGDIEETILVVPDPKMIYEGRKAGLLKKLPPSESVSIPANLDGKPYEIKGTVRYHLNEEYDKFYQAKGTDSK